MSSDGTHVRLVGTRPPTPDPTTGDPLPTGDPADATAQRITSDLIARAERLATAAARARHGEDADAVHDLRVVARRLTAALELYRPWIHPRPARRARRCVQRIRRDLRAARDLEVVLADLRARHDDAALPVREALAPLLTTLERRLERQRARTSRAARLKRVERIQRLLGRAFGVRRRAPATPGAQALDEHVAKRRQQVGDALAYAFEHGDDSTLHAARIRIKRWRYALESASALNPLTVADDLLKRLRLLQGALGRIQDLAVVRAVVARRLARAISRERAADVQGLAPVLQAIAAERAGALGKAYRLGSTLSGGLPAPALAGD